MRKSSLDQAIMVKEWIWIRKDGNEQAVTARLGTPYHVDNDIWACPAELAGVYSQFPDICGGSALQALSLALRTLHALVAELVDSQETLVDANDRSWRLTRQDVDVSFARD